MIFSRSGECYSLQPQRYWVGIRPATRLTLCILVVLVANGSSPRALGQAQSPDDRQNRVYGTVINAVTHEPIGRALVFSPDNRFATLTDAEGHFEFALPKDSNESGAGFVTDSAGTGQIQRTWVAGAGGGPSWLMARKPGFLEDRNEHRQGDVFPGSELTISLMPEAFIKGRVTISAGDVAAGVNVQLFSRQVQDGMARWLPGISAQTNSTGEFRLAELAPGAYKLVTQEWMDNDPVASVPGSQLYGFPPVYYPAAGDFAAATTIQLSGGQTYQADLSIIRQPYYPVTIPIVNSDADSGVRITVSPQGNRSPGYSLGYNAAKQTIGGSLPKGNYLVEAAAYGPNPSSGSVNLAVAGAPAEASSMVLTPNSSIRVNVVEEFTSTDRSGEVSWSDGRRTFSLRGPRSYLQGLRLEPADDFERQGARPLRNPTGPNDESLVLENLAPGRYWLRLRPSRGYVASVTRDGIDLLHHSLVVGSGLTAPIEIKMRDDSAEIDGTVAGIAVQSATTGGATFRSGISSSQVWVYCVPLADSPGQLQEQPVSSEGKFNSPNMAPGTYRVMAFKNQQPDLPYRDAESMRAYEAKGQVVHLSPGQKVTVQLQISSSTE